jgi:hypothetical protein
MRAMNESDRKLGQQLGRFQGCRAVLAACLFVSVLAPASVTVAQSAQPAKPAPGPVPAASPTAATPGAPMPAPAGAPTPVPVLDPTKVAPEAMPDPVRIRRLEQRVQALKERAWRAKARVGMLKESVLGGGVGSQAVIAHSNDMGSAFRLVKLVYSLDGTQVFARTDETAESLYKTKKFDVYGGPISPGSHSVSVLAVYRGNGYGVFKYLNKYTFQVRSSNTFTAGEGRTTKVDASGYEKGGATTPVEKRPAIEFKVTQIAPDGGTKSDDATKPNPTAPAASTTPGK